MPDAIWKRSEINFELGSKECLLENWKTHQVKNLEEFCDDYCLFSQTVRPWPVVKCSGDYKQEYIIEITWMKFGNPVLKNHQKTHTSEKEWYLRWITRSTPKNVKTRILKFCTI